MRTFTAAVESYDPRDLSAAAHDRGWAVDSSRAAVLVHDLLPYYVDLLPSAVRDVVVAETQRVVAWAHAKSVPVIASAPRAATSLEQRGLGGRLWGLGPSEIEARTSSLPELGDAVWIGKRSYSAFFGTDLAVELRRQGRDQLVIAGVFASAGILATTFDALANDIESFVVIEATADYDRSKHEAALRQIGSTTGAVISTAALGLDPRSAAGPTTR